MDDFSLSSVSFLSEVGEVLNFFAYFFISRKKSKWGAGLAPIKNSVSKPENSFTKTVNKFQDDTEGKVKNNKYTKVRCDAPCFTLALPSTNSSQLRCFVSIQALAD